MATTKKTTTKKTTAKAENKPALKIVEPVEVQETVFDKMARMFPVSIAHVELGDGIAVDVKNRIGFSDVISLVKSIVDACTNEEMGEVSFEIFDYVTKLFIVCSYCGLDVPEDPEPGYAAVCGADRMYELISDHIDNEQLNVIWASAREKLLARQDMFQSTALSQVKELLNKLGDLMTLTQEAVDVFESGELEELMKELPGNLGVQQ